MKGRGAFPDGICGWAIGEPDGPVSNSQENILGTFEIKGNIQNTCFEPYQNVKRRFVIMI